VLDTGVTLDALSGSGTVTIGSFGDLTGSFSLVQSGTSRTVSWTDLAAHLAAGGATLTVTSTSGSFTVDAGAVVGSAPGALSLSGIPGVSVSGEPFVLTVDTSSPGHEVYSVTGTGTLDLGTTGSLTATFSAVKDGAQLTLTVSSAT